MSTHRLPSVTTSYVWLLCCSAVEGTDLGPDPFELLAEHREMVWRRDERSCSRCAACITKWEASDDSQLKQQ